MDWFESLTGFREKSYDDTRARLTVSDKELKSLVNGKRYCVGELELVSLHLLRERARSGRNALGKLEVQVIRGDVRQLHRSAEYAQALFQVASQFNLLEMTSPDVTPEDGVTRYQYDRTQGPACAMAAGAATIYRNYFVPVGGGYGQTRDRQLDGLFDLGTALSRDLNRPVDDFWTMQNGYALCRGAGLDALRDYLRAAGAGDVDRLRDLLRIGVHHGVEVTDGAEPGRQFVTQAFCSALPVAYTNIPAARWEPFAQLVLEAAYEATLWAGVVNAQQNGSNIVLLTQLGGGAFGNEETWIHGAMHRALTTVREFALDVRLVSYSPATSSMLALVKAFSI